MNKIIIAAAATLVVSATALTSTAQAGGGVRVGFGFPLGSFVARPTSQPYHARPTQQYRAPVQAQKNWGKRKPMVAQRNRIETEDSAAPRRASRVANKKVSKPEIEETTTASNDPGQGSTVTAALTAAQVAPEVTSEPKPITTEVPVKELVTVEPPPAAAIETGSTSVPAQVVKQEVASPVVQPLESTSAPRKTAKKGLECRKFIPAVGVTISVRCED